MIKIKFVEQPDEKVRITKKIMHSLPAWFNPPEDIDKKALIHMAYPFFTAYDADRPVGFITLKIHNGYTADIFNLGVLEQYHRQGIGRNLINAAERYCKDEGYQCLTVKTLDSSAKYEPYEKTRAFYYRMGFVPLEVLTTFWNEENPCLFMAKFLGKNEGMHSVQVLAMQQDTPLESTESAAERALTGQDIHCKKADTADMVRIMQIDRLFRREKIDKAVRRGECYIAEKSAQIVGFAIMDYSFFDCGFVELLVVGEEHRRHGIGTALLMYLFNKCATEKLFISTNESNIPMKELLAKTGFKPCGQIDALDEGDPELFFFRRKSSAQVEN